MKTLITAVRIREDRAELLREKTIEIFKKTGELYREAELVNFLIDGYAQDITVNDKGELKVAK